MHVRTLRWLLLPVINLDIIPVVGDGGHWSGPGTCLGRWGRRYTPRNLVGWAQISTPFPLDGRVLDDAGSKTDFPLSCS